jgi:hypothetical protein
MDETGATDVPASDVVSVADAQPIPIVNSEGAFRENWRESLPENIRGDAVWDRIKDFNGMAGVLANAERMVGKNKIAIPGENSSDEEWEAWHNAGGRPEKSEDYGFSKPEDFPEEYYSQEFTTAAQELMHKIGLSRKQAQALFEFNNSNILQQLKDKVESGDLAAKKAAEELQNGLLTDWGNAYEQKKHLGNLAIEQGVKGESAELKERLLEKYGNDPDFIRFAANIGKNFAETKGIAPGLSVAATPDEIQGKIDELQSSDAFVQRNNPGHKAALAKMTELYKEKNRAKQPA